MKIAVCISGHLRHYDQIKDKYDLFIAHLKEFGQVDVFVSTWNRQNTLNSWSSAHGISNVETYNNFIDPDQVKKHFEAKDVSVFDYDFYSSNYSPLSYKKFTINEYNWDARGINGSVINSSKMFFLINKSNELKKINEYKNNFTYDAVFRVRPDYEFDQEGVKNIFVENLQPKCIYCGKPYQDSPPIDDQFAFGNSESMDLYSSTLNTVCIPYHNNIFGDPESLLNLSILKFFKLRVARIERVGVLGSDITSFKR